MPVRLLLLLLGLLQAITTCTAFLSPSSSLAFSTTSTSRTTTNSLGSSQVFDADKLDAAEALRQKSYKRTQDRQGNDPEWSFFDESRIHVSGGDGGNGCVAFRREKGEARGGPNGGRGGRGGSVYLQVDETLNTLMPLKQKVHWRAKKGNNGLGKGKDGSFGDDVYVLVPPGTVVRDLKTQKLAGELRQPGQTLLVARGGRGGRGTLCVRGNLGACAQKGWNTPNDGSQYRNLLVSLTLVVVFFSNRKRCLFDGPSNGSQNCRTRRTGCSAMAFD